MPKQKSNALVVYSGDPNPSPKGMSLQDVKALIAQAMESVKKSMEKSKKQNVSTGGIPEYAKLLVDPIHGPLVPRPDYSVYPSNVYRLVDVYNVTATPYAAVFGAGLVGSTYVSPTIAANAVTSWGSSIDSQYYSSLNTDNTQSRCIVFCVQWIPTANANTSQGLIHMGGYAGTSTLAGVPLANINSYMDDNLGFTGQASEEACVISRPNIPPFFSNVIASSGGNFPSVVFAASGLASGATGSLIVTRLIECVPLTGNIPSMTAKRTPCDPFACAIGDNISIGTTNVAVGDGCYDAMVKRGTAVAKASTADFENWSGSNSMSRMRAFAQAA